MPDDWGGIERYLSYLAPALAERGHDVLTSCVKGSPLDSRLKGLKVPLRVKGKYDFLAMSRYLKLFREKKFDLVVTHFSPDYLMPAWAARMRNQRRIVLTRHVAVTFKPNRTRQYAKLYDGFIGVSGAVCRTLKVSGLPRERVHVVLGGCPALVPTLERGEARKRYGARGFSIGIFGRMVPEKGHLFGIEAVNHSGVEDGVVHLFGRGGYRDEIRRVCTDVWGMEWHTPQEANEGFATGVVDHGQLDDVASAMAAMDLILVPSVWEEAFGFVATEAMSLGLPVVAFGVGGLQEIIDDGTDGFLVEPKNARSMGDVIRRLAGDAPLRDKIGAAAQAKHGAKFTVEKLTERTLDTYEAILASNPV